MIKRILFITLSNIGDVILTFPTLDYLRQNYPSARFTVLVGPKAKDLFLDNPYVEDLIVYNKKAPLREKIKLFSVLKKENFDIVVDLRNSLFGILLPSKVKTSLFVPKQIKHSRFQHLYRVTRKKIVPEPKRGFLFISQEDKAYISELFRGINLKEDEEFIVFACGARSSLKRWWPDKFVELIKQVVREFKIKIILVGDEKDSLISSYIKEKVPEVIDWAGKTKILQLAELLKISMLV
ncbi:MAG: glycosyltransferase family 9 protein, partial [Candidatus Omnitrophica bacterium]|nr:glycosyltransferase family 9 protein [Candidatus Omnitrophota bacterium]